MNDKIEFKTPSGESHDGGKSKFMISDEDGHMASKDSPKMNFVTPKQITDAESKKSPKPIRKLIFLVGFKNTGKDTVAKILRDVSVDPVEIVAFADALKKEVYPKLGAEWNGVDSEDREWKEAHRAEIISYGEGKKQEHGQYHWVNKALGGILTRKYERTADIPHIIVTDCRRVEEIMWFKHFKLKHFSELVPAGVIYEPVMYGVHRKGADVEDKDYLTHVAIEYMLETRVMHGMLRNYDDEKKLKNLVADWYVRDIK